MKHCLIAAALLNLCGLSAGAADELIPLPIRQVRAGGEIGRRIDVTVSNNLLALNAEKDFLLPFQEKKGKGGYIGLGKLILSTVRFAAYSNDPRVLGLKNRLVSSVISAQEAGGYAGLCAPPSRLQALWDVHEMAYLAAGLLADYELFGGQPSLEAARKAAGYLLKHWAEIPPDWGRRTGVAAHVAVTGLERTLIALHRATKDARYLDFVLKQRALGEWDLPIVIGRRAGIEGHIYAYMARSLAQLELYRLRPEPRLLVPARRAVEFLTRGEGLAVTGGAGQWEIWTDDQDGRGELAETCATAYQLRVYDSLLRLKGEPVFGDLMERTIHNTLFAAQSPEGRRIRYYAPLEGARAYHPSDTYCCPTNYRRIVAELPEMIYYRWRTGLAVNLYTASEATLEVAGGVALKVRQETAYPSQGQVTLRLDPARPAKFPLRLRIPAWARGARVTVNGRPAGVTVMPGSFADLDREWRAGDSVSLDLPMRIRLVHGRQRQAGRVAVLRGPLVFTLNPAQQKALENLDAADLGRHTLDPASLELVRDDSVRPGGVAVRAGAWRPGYSTAAKHDLAFTLTEFADPGGRATYFKLRNPAAAGEDELLGGERPRTWSVLGPGGGGAQFLPTISPHDPDHVLVACDMTGTYLTRDGGANWRMFNLRGRSSLLLFDPADPDVIYSRSIGLWRSSDRGDTWNLVVPDPETVTGIDMPDDHASERLLTSRPAPGTVNALAVDPADSKTLYAILNTSGRNTLQVSTDWGATWTPVRDVPAGTSRIYLDPRSPREDRLLYVVAGNLVLVREGGVWRTGAPVPEKANLTDVSAGFPESGGRLVVYGIAGSGLWVSIDGGASWNKAGPAASFTAVATSLQRAHVAYLSYKGLREGSQTFFGVARTADMGGSWEIVWKESDVKSPNVDDGWISERLGPGWGENPLSLGVSPTDPDLCYGTDYGRTLRTTDGGKTWKAAYTRKLADGSFQSTGLDVTTNYGVHFDPFDIGRRFISYTDIGLFRGESGSQGWVSSTTSGVPRAWRNTTYWLEFDPQVQGRMWAVMSGTHDLPRPKMWRTISPSTYQGGAARSDDGGKTWRTLTNGMPATAATHILLDPRSPADARVLYVTGFGRGVFKSVDGGESWTLRNNGLPEKEPFAWRLAQDRESVLYLVIARRSDDTSFGTPNDGALYRSTDGAESWQKMALPEGVNGPNGLAIDPRDSRRLYLACWGRRTSLGAVGGGIFLSEDGGATWRHVHRADQHVYDVTIDPRDPATLYACGFESSAWRSTDHGETWQRIRGYNFKWGHRVAPDPADPQMIYVTTFGGSLWHGPAAGDPNAVEDIVTPQVSFSK